MLKGKSLLDYANLFSPNEYEKNDKVILKYFDQLETKTSFYEYIVKMGRETIRQEYRLKNIEEIKKIFIKEVD